MGRRERERRPILLALLCNCFKDCDPQAKMTGRNYWCRHLIYHLHNGPRDQERNHQPHMTLVAHWHWLSLISPWWDVWGLTMYCSPTNIWTSQYSPILHHSTVIKPSLLTKCEDHNVFSQEFVNFGLLRFTYFLSVKPLSWWWLMLTPTPPHDMQMSFQKIRFPQRGIIMTKQFLCSTNGNGNCAS